MPKKTTTIDINISRQYRFCGDGAGIPGLPHEVTTMQAHELGLLDVLEAALKNGNYKPVDIAADEPAAEKE